MTFSELSEVLQSATKEGLMDELACYLHPDTINLFCDTVNGLGAVEQLSKENFDASL